MLINAAELLTTAAKTLGERAKERDVAQERAMKRTVALFNAFAPANQITEAQGWAFMLFLKLVRGSQGQFRADDYVDASAYAALMGECLSQEPEPVRHTVTFYSGEAHRSQPDLPFQDPDSPI